MSGISVIVITLNEADNIRECLESVQWANEIVVVDAESRDDTVAIARQLQAQVFVRPWEGFSAAKNFALQQCRQDWVLWLDADERVPPELAQEIRQAVQDSPFAGYEIPRLANFLGKWIWHSGWYPGYVLRLFRREAGRFNQNKVHEGVQLQGKVGRLKNHLLHYTDRTIRHYFSKLNHYTSLAAEQLNDRKVRFHIHDLLLRPPYMFVRMYILKRGFLDGLHGFILAAFSASYVLAKYAKLWEIQFLQHRQGSPKTTDDVAKSVADSN